MPLLSVIIPCHNAEPWLQNAVGSICSQSFTGIELIIYNDGSTDGSDAIIKRLSSVDSRVIAMGEPNNRGIVHALNAMLDVARGRYIARMDADDICLPHRLERQLDFLKAGHADLCGTWFQEFGDGISRSVRWPTAPDELRAAMLFQNTICHPTVMARREVFDCFRYREGYNLSEDYDLFVRALSKFRLANVPEVLLRYRRHKQQATRAKREAMERVACRIRIEALQAQGINPSAEEQRIHNAIRAPKSIGSLADLEQIEAWLVKLLQGASHPGAKRIIASQWTRAAIRAAPLGWAMWRTYRRSPLRAWLGGAFHSDLDLAVLAALKLDYRSPAFDALRRFGLSA